MDEADGDDGQQPDDEDHRGQQEGARRLAQAAQVEQHDEEKDPQAQRNGGAVQRREGRLEPGDTGGDGDGDGERVVDDERRRGDEARVGAEVRPGDGVGAAAHRIGVDDLAVREDQDRQEGDDGDRDGEDEVQGPGARHGQHEDDRLGPVGDRGQCVERQGRQALDRGDPLLPTAQGRTGRTHQQLPDRGHAAAVRVCHSQDSTAGVSPAPDTRSLPTRLPVRYV